MQRVAVALPYDEIIFDTYNNSCFRFGEVDII